MSDLAMTEPLAARQPTNTRSRRHDIAAAVVIAVVVLLLGFAVGGGPLYWDDLGYLYASIHTPATGTILNRYAHLYLLKPFAVLAPSPIEGAAVFWWLLISVTTSAIFLILRRTAADSYLPAIAGVLLFLTQPLIFEHAGAPLADFTVMALATVAALVFLVAVSKPQGGGEKYLVLLGFLVFAGMKSKETMAPIAAVLLLGLFAVPARHLAQRLRAGAMVLAGAIAAQLLLMGVDALVLGDPLFSVRLTSLEQLLQFNLREDWPRTDRSWFELLTSAPLLLTFLLALVAGPRERGSRGTGLLILWLVPLALMLFLTASMIKGAWGVIDRYFLPGIPFLCICAAHAFEGKLSRRKFLLVGGTAVGALGVGLLVMSGLGNRISELGWSSDAFMDAIVTPSIAIAALAAFGFSAHRGSRLAALSSALLLSIAPGLLALFMMPLEKTTARRSSLRFAPILEASQHVSLTPTSRIFVSERIVKQSGMLCRDASSCAWMFSIALGIDFRTDQFTLATPDEEALAKDHDLIFMTGNEWRGISTGGNDEYRLPVPEPFGADSPVFAAIASYHDPDPAQLRQAHRDQTLPVTIDEDGSRDPERDHGSETVGFLVFDRPGIIEARGPDGLRAVGEIQRVEQLLHRPPSEIRLLRHYENPVVFFGPFWYPEDPTTIEVREKSGRNVLLFAREANSRKNDFARVSAWMLVLERGNWTLGSDTSVHVSETWIEGSGEAGSIGWEDVVLPTELGAEPVLIPHLQSSHPTLWLKVRQRQASHGRPQLALEAEEGTAVQGNALVGLLAIEASRGSADGVSYIASMRPHLALKLAKLRVVSRSDGIVIATR